MPTRSSTSYSLLGVSDLDAGTPLGTSATVWTAWTAIAATATSAMTTALSLIAAASAHTTLWFGQKCTSAQTDLPVSFDAQHLD